MTSKMKHLAIIGVVVAVAVVTSFFVLGNGSSDPLGGTSWTRTTEVDSEVINFNNDGHFAYYYGVGSPVDDYDLYDRYVYDSDANTIVLKGVDSFADRNWTVVSISESTLVLVIDGEERTFKPDDN